MSLSMEYKMKCKICGKKNCWWLKEEIKINKKRIAIGDKPIEVCSEK